MRSLNHRSSLLSLLFILLFADAGAQQVFKLSQFMENSFIHNPAAAGANGVTTIGAAYRSQWAALEGGPQTVLLFGDTYFASKNTGAGIILYSDKTGPTSQAGGELSLSYSVKFRGEKKRLMLGLGGQVIQFKVDKEKIAASIPNDPLLASSGTVTRGDASAGIYFHSEKLNVGVSVKQLIQAKLKLITTSTNPQGMLYRQYFMNANYSLRTDEANVLLPHVEVRYQPGVPVDYEGGIILYHQDILHVGFSLHYKQNYTVFAGIKIRHQLSIGYAYDIYNTPASAYEYGYGAHEIMLRYFWRK